MQAPENPPAYSHTQSSSVQLRSGPLSRHPHGLPSRRSTPQGVLAEELENNLDEMMDPGHTASVVPGDPAVRLSDDGLKASASTSRDQSSGYSRPGVRSRRWPLSPDLPSLRSMVSPIG